jgi:A/G-specific adenine glycosylase
MNEPTAEKPDEAFRVEFPELAHRLLAWFFRNKRDLPWREEHDPYRVWISEVMLQQTRSATAAAYYHRWLRRFPTVQSLARADEEEVLKLWEGLGYYSRARNLHRAARILVDRWEGCFPDTERQLRALPGIGDYTAAAVLSIAYALPLGVVDGNVLRVVSRMLAESGRTAPGRTTAGRTTAGRATAGRALKKLARAFVEESFQHYHPGWINQAWMELGALVCLPKPRCSLCPLSYACRAFQEGRVGEFPPKASAGPLPTRVESLLILLPAHLPESLLGQLPGSGSGTIDPGAVGRALQACRLPVLLVKRHAGGLLGGLWEMPNFPERGRRLAAVLEPLSIDILLDTAQEVRHRYSHFEIRFQLLVASGTPPPLPPWIEQRWVRPAELEAYPRPKVQIKAMRLFGLSES